MHYNAALYCTCAASHRMVAHGGCAALLCAPPHDITAHLVYQLPHTFLTSFSTPVITLWTHCLSPPHTLYPNMPCNPALHHSALHYLKAKISIILLGVPRQVASHCAASDHSVYAMIWRTTSLHYLASLCVSLRCIQYASPIQSCQFNCIQHQTAMQ
jgi:hypothetical protein